jgi:carbonic anhydrase
MLFEAILERSKGSAPGLPAKPLPPPKPVGLAVVACVEPSVDGLLGSALGLEAGEAAIIRTPGAWVGPESEALRSLGVAAYLLGVTEVVVIGHSSCRLASFDTSAFIDAFRRRGVPREAFGPESIRSWVGAIPDAKRGVAVSVSAIAGAPFLPRDLRVGGLLLDDATGALEVVLRPGEAPPEGVADSPGPETAAAEMDAVEERPAGSRPPSSPVKDPLLVAARSALRALAATGDWRNEIRRLRAELQRTRDPLTRLALLKTFTGRAAEQSREVAEELRRLKRQGVGAGGTVGQAGLLEVFSRALEEEGL